MILEGYLKCSTCGRVDLKKIFLKTTNYLTKDNPRELEWRCDNCGMLNFIEVKVKEVD